LIALAWYSSRDIKPLAKELDARIETAKAEAEQKRAGILSDARRVGIAVSQLQALSDTLEVRFLKYDGLIDSVYALREADLTELRTLETQMDSLRQVYSTAKGQSEELSSLLPPMQARVDSLKELIAGQEAEIRRLESERDADKDLRERILDPNRFRKNTALWVGPGRFPNRDSLEKR